MSPALLRESGAAALADRDDEWQRSCPARSAGHRVANGAAQGNGARGVAKSDPGAGGRVVAGQQLSVSWHLPAPARCAAGAAAPAPLRRARPSGSRGRLEPGTDRITPAIACSPSAERPPEPRRLAGEGADHAVGNRDDPRRHALSELAE